MDWITLIVFVASIPLAGAMARARGRSFKAWLWISVLIGPLAPLALAILGQSRDGRTAPAN